MALPDTIRVEPHVNGDNPPHKSSGGNYYTVVIEETTGAPIHAIDVFKSTNPGTAAWSVQDATNNPVASSTATTQGTISTVSDGTYIHIAALEVTDSSSIDELRYHRFDMSTDTWDIVDHTVANLTGMSAPFTRVGWCSIALRAKANDEVVIACCDLSDSDMGTAYQRASFWHGTDGATPSFTGPVSVNTVVSEHYTNPQLVLGTADGMHIIWGMDADSTLSNHEEHEGRTLNSSNALSTIVSSTPSTFGHQRSIVRPVSYDSAGTQLVQFVYAANNLLQIREWSEDGSNDLSASGAEVEISSTAVIMSTNTPPLTLVEDAGNLHVLWSGGGNSVGGDADLYYKTSTDDGATWTGENEELDAATINHVKADILDASTIAYLYDNAGTVYYNEISLGAAIVLTLPTEASITDTTVTIGCTTDTAAGTLYYYISTSATAPSEADLKAGTGSVKFGSKLTPGVGIETFAVTGLVSGTEYYTYFLQE